MQVNLRQNSRMTYRDPAILESRKRKTQDRAEQQQRTNTLVEEEVDDI